MKKNKHTWRESLDTFFSNSDGKDLKIHFKFKILSQTKEWVLFKWETELGIINGIINKQSLQVYIWTKEGEIATQTFDKCFEEKYQNVPWEEFWKILSLSEILQSTTIPERVKNEIKLSVI